jgi:hypothetical protein
MVCPLTLQAKSAAKNDECRPNDWHGPCFVMAVRIDNRHYSETHMNTLSSKLTTFVAALVMDSLIMGAVGFLFEIQSHPNMSVISFAGSRRSSMANLVLRLRRDVF